MSSSSCSHTRGPVRTEAAASCVNRGEAVICGLLLESIADALVLMLHSASSSAAPLAGPPEGLTSRGTVYPDCSLYIVVSPWGPIPEPMGAGYNEPIQGRK